MTATDFDRIEREIAINAPAQRVWDLVSEPGWYINEQELVPHQITESDGLTTVVDPTLGSFVFRVVELDEPRYAAFRCYFDSDNPDGASTLVEFWVTQTDDGVLLKVAESGFESLDEPEVNRRSRFDDHREGWLVQLELARAQLVGGHARA